MLDIQKTTGPAPVDDLIEGVRLRRTLVGVKRDIFSREVMRRGVSSCLLANILVGWAAVLDGLRSRGGGGGGGIR